MNKQICSYYQSIIKEEVVTSFNLLISISRSQKKVWYNIMACLSSSEKNKSEQYGFKIVPESISDITADWCENILQKGSTISNETKVTELTVQSLTNDTDQDDGGGLSGATLLKLIPTYGYVRITVGS